MTDLPPALAADRALVLAWVELAKPGEMPPAGVVAAQARCAAWLGENRRPAIAQQPNKPTDNATQLSAIERFKNQTTRPDAPPKMADWNRDQAFADSPQPQSAAERFKALRLSDVDQSKMPPWRDPRQA
jgi:hypothetical protein